MEIIRELYETYETIENVNRIENIKQNSVIVSFSNDNSDIELDFEDIVVIKE
jgi:hypothetical protein